MTMGKNTLGMSKHRKSGKTSKSPQLRHSMKRDAEVKSIKRRKSSCKYKTVAEALRKNK